MVVFYIAYRLGIGHPTREGRRQINTETDAQTHGKNRKTTAENLRYTIYQKRKHQVYLQQAIYNHVYIYLHKIYALTKLI